MKMVNDKKDFNWGILLLGLMTIGVWYSIFTNGFFITIIWLVVLSCVIGLWLRLTGRA
jgi:hypothetical protein